MANEPANKVIYSMIGVSKVYDKKPVLKDIYLSYFYGAKIGVLGLNGSGKSSLLRILAGVGHGFHREDDPLPRPYRRLPRTGAEARRNENGPGDRRAGGPGDGRSAERVQRDQRKIRRADDGRGDEQTPRPAGEGPGETGRTWMPGTSIPAWRWRWMPSAARRGKPR